MEDQRSNFRWLILVLLFLIYFFIFTATNCIPPLFKEIGNEIALTKAGMGMIMGVITLPALFFSLLGGAISDKVGSRWAIGSALIIISLSGAFRATVESNYASSWNLCHGDSSWISISCFWRMAKSHVGIRGLPDDARSFVDALI